MKWKIKPEPAHPLLAAFGISYIWWTIDDRGIPQHPHRSLAAAMDCAYWRIEVKAMESVPVIEGDPR